MSELICRKTMRNCTTPSMCAPFGGCGDDKIDRIIELENEIKAYKQAIAEVRGLLDLSKEAHNVANNALCEVEARVKRFIIN